MDLILEVADKLILDKVWAQLVPLAAFLEPAAPLSSPAVVLSAPPSIWTNVLRSLPHPPITSDAILSASKHVPISAWPRDYVVRQILSVSALTIIGIHIVYFLFAGLSYYYIFNHEMMKHPKFLKNQVRLEIQASLKGFPGMLLLTLPVFMAEVRGYTMMYDNVADYGWTYLILSVPL